VGELVLRDNVLQNLALSMTEALGPELLDAQLRLMRKLERQGRLDREVEDLPSDRELAERRKAGQGLSRPELAVLLSYAKMTLYEDVLRTELPDRAYLQAGLTKYFPRPLRRRYADAIAQHRLRREITATLIANSVVNRGLAVFVSELEEETDASLEEVLLAYATVRDSFGLLRAWGSVESLPTTVPGDLQTRLLVAIRDVAVRGTRWFITQGARPFRMRDAVARFRPGIETVMTSLAAVIGPRQAAEIDGAQGEFESAGVDATVARQIASLPQLLAACDIVRTSPSGGGEAGLLGAARVHFALDGALDLPWLRRQLRTAPRRGRWDRLALTGLEDDISSHLRALTQAASSAGAEGADAAATQANVETWLEREVPQLRRFRALLEELRQMPEPDLAVLSVAVRTLAELVPRGLDT
jgi:glutamate dehydrogenase